MKEKRYFISQQCLAYVLLVSLFLQSCYNQANAPEGDKLPGSASLMATNQEEEGTNELVPDNQADSLQVQEEKGRGIKRINSQQLLKEVSTQGKKEQYKELDTFSTFPKEIWQLILSYVPAAHIGKIRQANRTFYRLTTGYQKPGSVGVVNKPAYNTNVDSWMLSKWINFSGGSFEKLTPSTIPSLLFYQFLEKAKDLPQSFWPYLKDTHIKEISFGFINASGIVALAKYLQGTKIHTLGLSKNKIGDSGAQALAKGLATSQIHTLSLRGNQIDDSIQSLLRAQYPGINWKF